ncbi:hypothetical protein [Streptomyces sp. NPDC005859]|uniref:hypothetical protein n=1 Tax=Streptomyces sp. NPDC005859 TaxID=3157170 RepID=UPI0033E166AB
MTPPVIGTYTDPQAPFEAVPAAAALADVRAARHRTAGLMVGVVAVPHHDGPAGAPQQSRTALSRVAQSLCPGTELVFEGEVVAAGHRLQQLGSHGRFGSEAGRAAQDGEGIADADGDVLLV